MRRAVRRCAEPPDPVSSGPRNRQRSLDRVTERTGPIATDDEARGHDGTASPKDGNQRPWIRADGQAKATGQARYTADLAFPGLVHAPLLLAGRAHARIRHLDTARARAVPGVLAVLTAADVPAGRYGSFDFILDRTLFATDVVRFEGEVVAAVAALTPEIATAAIEAIEVDYEDLPAILDVEAAL